MAERKAELGRGVFDKELIQKAIELAPNGDPGRIYALIYEATLEELKQEGKIKEYEETQRFGEDDSNGIDFFVLTNRNVKVPISITSTKDLFSRRLDKHPEIPQVYVRERKYDKDNRLIEDHTKSIDQLKRESLALIASYCRIQERKQRNKKRRS